MPWHEELITMRTVTCSTDLVVYAWRISPDLIRSTMNGYDISSAVAIIME
jgi:hypothetical protein